MLQFIKETRTVNKNGRSRKFAKYLCECGLTVEKNIDNVKYGGVSNCGKCVSRPLATLPLTIGGLDVIKDLGMDKQVPRKRIALFKCECGKEFIATVNSVKSGQKRSCGCARGLSNVSHNLSKHSLYRKWGGMISRTENTNESCWNRYGGRGISICPQWRQSFESFYKWSMENGWEEGLTIDRINNNGNYEPSNCQFISMNENRIKDSIKFNPSAIDIKNICSTYINSHITITELANIYSTHKERISNILKENNIKIVHRRMKKC